MKDIDFDELDKAVNSLMGGIKDQSDQPVPKTLNISTTLKENESPEYTKLEQVAQKIGSETIGGPIERTAILSEADEEGPTTTVELTAEKMTSGPLAQPASPTVPTATVTPAPETKAVESSPAPAARPTVAARRSSGRFMDVMHPSSDMKTSAAAGPSAPSREAATIMPPERAAASAPAIPAIDAPAKSPADPVEPEKAVTPAEPLTSPFLPDAKVEKRPLGGAPAGSDSDDGDVIDQLGASEDERQKDTQLAPNPSESTEAELPEELNDNLLAIETNLAVEGPIEEPAPAAVPVVLPGEEEKKPEPIGSASIPQQYQELPSSGDQSNGAIFDVDAYHKQPAHPAKTSSSWLWIVLIIIIVIVCGAGAAAFYLLGTK